MVYDGRCHDLPLQTADMEIGKTKSIRGELCYEAVLEDLDLYHAGALLTQGEATGPENGLVDRHSGVGKGIGLAVVAHGSN